MSNNNNDNLIKWFILLCTPIGWVWLIIKGFVAIAGGTYIFCDNVNKKYGTQITGNTLKDKIYNIVSHHKWANIRLYDIERELKNNLDYKEQRELKTLEIKAVLHELANEDKIIMRPIGNNEFLYRGKMSTKKNEFNF